MQKLLLLLAFWSFTVFGYSQYRYEISLQSLNGVSPKKAYSQICKKIEFTNRKVVGNNLIFESKNNYSQGKMEQIIQLAGYDLLLFRVTTIREESFDSKSE